MSFDVDPQREFSIAILPDTQYYSRDNPSIFEGQTQWIIDNRDAYNIQMVLHEGDLVHNYDGATDEWDAAEAAMDSLDNNNLPSVTVIGNHDADDLRNPSTFRDRFPTSRYQDMEANNDTISGYGTYESLPENVYPLQDVLGEKFLYLGLELGPRQEVLDWANSLVNNYSDRLVIVNIHTFTSWTGEPDHEGNANRPPSYYLDGDDHHNGEEMWDELVKNHDNIIHVTSGHYVDQTENNIFAATGHNWSDEANWVTHSFVNYQDYTDGGNGFLRLLTLDVESQEARVHTYSPHVDTWRTNSAEEFEFSYWRPWREEYRSHGRLQTGPISADGGSIELASGDDWLDAETLENIEVTNGQVLAQEPAVPPAIQNATYHYPMDSGSGSVLVAETGYLDGDINTASWDSSAGYGGYNLSFVASDEYAVIPDNGRWNSLDQFTLNFWFQLNSITDSWQAGFQKYTNGSGIYVTPSRNNSGNTHQFTWRVVGPNDDTGTMDEHFEPNTGQWYMTTLTYDGSEITFYLDGSEAESIAFDGPAINYDGNAHVGTNAGDQTQALDGNMDYLAWVADDYWTADDVQAVYEYTESNYA